MLGTAATVSGIVLLLALKPHSAPAPALAHATVPASSQPSPSSAPKASSGSKASGSSKTNGTSKTSSPQRTETVTGDTVQTDYGPVQVRVTLVGGRITGVTALQSPSGNPRSEEIASYSIPQLTREAIAAQSAHIDAVSGASYTSAGYTQSLQSALDRAGG
jgi:uncharacterized protein with FMN-binding domain